MPEDSRQRQLAVVPSHRRAPTTWRTSMATNLMYVPDEIVERSREATRTPVIDDAPPTLESQRAAYQRLSEREREVVRLVGQGFSAPEIGAHLKISAKTV